MNDNDLIKLILSPYVSEKATVGTEKRNEYVFEVRKVASKPKIKAAIELMFKTKVDTVRIVNVKTKAKRFGNIQGKRKAWKKAYVKLLAGQKIDFVGAQ